LVITGFEDVIGKRVFAGEVAKVLRFDSNEPKSEFPTSGTIASIGFFRGFDIGFEFDGAAYTASVVLFCGHCFRMDKEKEQRRWCVGEKMRPRQYLICDRRYSPGLGQSPEIE
jgi:hypothetical protein